jgi:type III pantothenate kinase
MTKRIADKQSVLLVDIGNSRVKWGLASDGRIVSGESFGSKDFAQFPASWQAMPPPAQVWIANVAGQKIAALFKTWIAQHWGLDPHFARSEAQRFGVVSGYTCPEKLGVDRWVALVGARHVCAGPVCVVDCGTALTFDVLDAKGQHLGGLIAPGLSLMRGALARGTHALPWTENLSEEGCFAHDTETAIAKGTGLAAVGLIERAFWDAAQYLGREPRLLLTGGDAPILETALNLSYEYWPDLVLEGLQVMAT